MRTINSISLAVISMCAAALVFSSCQREELRASDDYRFINLAVSADNSIETKSLSGEITSLDLSNSELDLFVTGNVSVYANDVFSPQVETKGVEIVKDDIKSFPVTMASGNTIYDGGQARPSGIGKYWSIFKGESSSSKVLWPADGVTYDFWAYYGADNASYSVSEESINQITYTGVGPQSNVVAKMSDFLVAYKSVTHNHKAQNLVELKFYHALAAVNFNIDVEGFTVNSITLKKVAQNGVVTVNKSTSGFTDAFSWVANTPVDYRFESSELGGTIFIVPQGLSDIIVVFNITKGGKTYEVSTKANNLGTSSWDAGYRYNYTISSANDGNVGIDVVESFDGEVKSNVYVKNTKRSTAYVRAALIGNWCVDVEKDGKTSQRVIASWTDSEAKAVTYNKEAWSLNSSDGFYYSNDPVEGFEKSADLIAEWNPSTVTKSINGVTCHLVVRVLAQAVEYDQAKTYFNNAWTKTSNN